MPKAVNYRLWLEEDTTLSCLRKSTRVVPDWEIPFDLKTTGDLSIFKNHPSFKYYRDRWIDMWRTVYESNTIFPHGFWAVRRYNEEEFLNGYLRSLVIAKHLLDNYMKDHRKIYNSFFKKFKFSTPLVNFFHCNRIYVILSIYPGNYDIWEFKHVPRQTFNPDHKGLDPTSIGLLDTLLKRLLVKILKEALRLKKIEHDPAFEVDDNYIFPRDVVRLKWTEINKIHNLERNFRSIMNLLEYVFGDYFNEVYRPRIPNKTDRKEYFEAGVDEIYMVMCKDFNNSGESNIKEFVYKSFKEEWFHKNRLGKFRQSTSTGLIIEAFTRHNISLEVLFFKNKPLFWFSNENGVNKEVIKEYQFLIACELEYEDPRNQFEERDLSLRGGLSIQHFYSRNYFPAKAEWESVSKRYRKRIEVGVLLETKKSLLENAPKISQLDYTRKELGGEIKLICPVSTCKAEIKIRSGTRHLRDIHWVDKVIGCEYCTDRFCNTGVLAEHKRVDHPGRFDCPFYMDPDPDRECPTEFHNANDIANVIQHLRTTECGDKLSPEDKIRYLIDKYHCDQDIHEHPRNRIYKAESPKKFLWHMDFYHEKKYFEGVIDIIYRLVGDRVFCVFEDCYVNTKRKNGDIGFDKKKIKPHYQMKHMIKDYFQCNIFEKTRCIFRTDNNMDMRKHRKEIHNSIGFAAGNIIYHKS